MLLIDPQKCNACKLCEHNCPFEAIKIVDDQPEVDDSCTLCGSCINVCTRGALSIKRRIVSARELAQYRGVMVIGECELRDGVLQPKKVVYELLSKGRQLADKLREELVAVAMGDERMASLDTLCHHGADRVLRCIHPLLGEFSTDGFCTVLSTVISRLKPSIVLYGATPNGRELAPRVAARLRLGLTADCTGLDIDEQGQLVQTRPAFGGNIMASIIAPNSRPQTATVRPNVFTADYLNPDRPVQVQKQPVHLSKAAIRTRVVSEIRFPCEEIAKIEAARIIVSAGRGCCKEKDLKKAGLLAEKLGGAMACSRPLVEEGLMPHTCQVGQSGNTVCPDVYIAAGISGAVQHAVGMNSSKTIIAINEDPEAPIFRIADLGIVGDAGQILSALLDALHTPSSVSDSGQSEAGRGVGIAD